MGLITYGGNEFRMGDFNTETGAIENTEVIPVYKDSFQMEDDEPTQNAFYQQGKKSPRLVRSVEPDDVVELSIMETSTAWLKKMFGGTVTTVNGRQVWHKPKLGRGEIIKGLEIDTEDGSLLRIPRGQWIARKSIRATDDGINLIPVRITATDTGLDEVADFQWGDPEVEEEEG